MTKGVDHSLFPKPVTGHELYLDTRYIIVALIVIFKILIKLTRTLFIISLMNGLASLATKLSIYDDTHSIFPQIIIFQDRTHIDLKLNENDL